MMEKQKYQQRFYDEVEKALKKHVKKNNITGEIIGETGIPNEDTVSYYLENMNPNKKTKVEQRIVRRW